MMFTGFSVTQLLVTPLAVTVMKSCGRVQVLFAGLFLQGSTSLIFGFADDITGGVGVNIGAALFVYTAMRFLSGTGSALASNAMMSMAADRFPDALGRVTGLNEVVIGLGFTLGPPIGTALYLSGDFSTPFLVCGVAACLLSPCTLTLLWWHDSAHHAGDEDSSGNDGLLALLTPGFLVPSIALCLATAVFGIVDSTLALYLKHEAGLSQAGIATVFTSLALTYSFFAPVAGWLSDRGGAGIIAAIGTLATGVVMSVCMGPAARLVESGTTWRFIFETVVLGLLGAAMACALIPSLPAMKAGVRDARSTTTQVVAWFTIFINLGLAVGPLIGTGLTMLLGFEASTLAWGMLIAAYGVLAMVCACHHGCTARIAPTGEGAFMGPASEA